MPLLRGLSPLDPLLAQVDASLTGQAWEFGRLVLDPGCRSGPELVRRSIFLAVQQLAHETDAANVFASCPPALARLYRRYGFTVLNSKVAGHGSGESYCLIHGEVEGVLAASADARPAVLN